MVIGQSYSGQGQPSGQPSIHGHFVNASVYSLLQFPGQTVSPGGHADIH